MHLLLRRHMLAHEALLCSCGNTRRWHGTAGTLFVAVHQQQVNPLGWPILLHPAACTSLAFTGQGKADAQPMQTTAGELFSVLVETQDALGHRISQVHDAICPTCVCLCVRVCVSLFVKG